MQSSTAVLCALCTQALLCTPVHSVHSAPCTEHMHPSALQYTVYMHLLYSLLSLQCTQYTQYCCYAVQMKGLTAVIVHCAVYTNTNIKVQKYRYKSTKVQIHANAFSANCHAQCIQCSHCPVCHLILKFNASTGGIELIQEKGEICTTYDMRYVQHNESFIALRRSVQQHIHGWFGAFYIYTCLHKCIHVYKGGLVLCKFQGEDRAQGTKSASETS